MLALELRLLTGRYVATSYNDRRSPEWPPHPARLFSALVATHFAAEEPDPAERRALEWLESLGAPQLGASKAFPRDDYTVFVPVNDLTVVGDFDKQEQQLAAAQAALTEQREALDAAGDDPKQRSKLTKAVAKAERQVASAREKLASAVAAKTDIPAKIGKDEPGRAVALLPERRVRQPRSVPGVTPAHPVVHFVWPEADAGEHGATLDRLAARLVRLGHSSSFVSLRVVSEAPRADHLPVEAGPRRFRVVRKGQLQRLETAFALHRETEPRIMPKAFQDYAGPPKPATAMPAPLLGDDWVVLERAAGPLLPATRIPDMAQAVRGALFAHAPDPLPEILSGHQADGSPSRAPHVAVVPLPFVGHHHADGLLRGVAIVFPRSLDLEQKSTVYRALRGWETKARNDDDSDTPPLPLRLGALGVLTLRRLDHVSNLHALRPDTWCRPARGWATVTPVALDRNPGDLRSRSPAKLRRAIGSAETVIREACGHLGLPEPRRVEILPAAPWAGVYKAKHFGPFPREAGRTRRVLTHVYVEFPERVRGPVILGAGRFVGLGLCKPVARGEE